MAGPAPNREALARLVARLTQIYIAAGRPPYRLLADKSEGVFSHTTAKNILDGRSWRWGNLEILVEILGGDIEEFRQLWTSCFEASPLGPKQSLAREDTLSERFHRAADAELVEDPKSALRKVELAIAAKRLEHVELLVRDGQEEKADKILAEIAEVQLNCGLDIDDPVVVKRRGLWAALLLRKGQVKEAKEVVDRLHEESRSRGIAVNDPDTEHTSALIMRELGQTKDAEDLMRKTVELRRDALGEDHRDTIRARRDLAALRCQRGGGDQPRAELNSIYALQRDRFGADDRDTLDTRLSLANLDLLAGRFSEAEREFDGIIKALTRTLGPDNRQTLRVRNSLAIALYRQGAKAEGRAELDLQ